MKKCPKCNKLKPESEFYIQKSGKHKGRLTSWCKDCSSQKSSVYYRENKGKCNAAHKKWVENNKERVAFSKAKSAYGISSEEYLKLRKVCQICGRKDNLVIDHSHMTGKVRGMLCQNCNKGIGLLQDNPILLARASDYVLGIFEKVEE